MKRQIVKINEDLCNGCGVCVTPCVEGAIELVNGKARVVSDELCDGAGFCLAVCPTGALTVEERDAVPFSEQAAEEHQHARGKRFIAQHCFRCGASEEKRRAHAGALAGRQHLGVHPLPAQPDSRLGPAGSGGIRPFSASPGNAAVKPR